jgi:FG-GAP repeat protein
MQKLTDTTGSPNDIFGISVSIPGNYAIASIEWDDISGIN